MLSSAKRLARKRLDEKLAALRVQNIPPPPPKGWLRAIREAIGMSGVQFARRLGVSWQSMDDLERSEANGTIGLETLRRAAAVLDCTVVYAVVPNGKLEAMVEGRARQLAVRALAKVDQTMLLEDQQVPVPDLEEAVRDYVGEHVRDRDLWSEQ